MTDYAELVKKLRKHNGWALNETLDTAADAIERLQNELEYTSRQYELALEDLEKAEQPGWIPVTERLPEKDGPVLVYYGFDRGNGFGKMFTRVLDYYATDRMPHFQNEGVMNLKVTHWMPLPEPPKEETE